MSATQDESATLQDLGTTERGPTEADEHWEQNINSPLVASLFYPAKHVGFNHFDQSF